MIKIWVAISLIISTSFCLAADPEVNIQYRGVLVADPCVIPPGEEVISLDFGAVIDKYLYLNTRTLSKKIEIHLTECDLSLGNSLKVTFLGIENAQLPGLLSIDEKSDARGIAIGIETIEGEPLPLNKESGRLILVPGHNILPFNVYLQGEPQAIKDRAIIHGLFSATATFNLEYE